MLRRLRPLVRPVVMPWVWCLAAAMAFLLATPGDGDGVGVGPVEVDLAPAPNWSPVPGRWFVTVEVASPDRDVADHFGLTPADLTAAGLPDPSAGPPRVFGSGLVQAGHTEAWGDPRWGIDYAEEGVLSVPRPTPGVTRWGATSLHWLAGFPLLWSAAWVWWRLRRTGRDGDG